MEFELDRDIDAAAGDVRDRVGRISDDLPDEALRWDGADSNDSANRDAGARTLAGLKSLLENP